MVVKNTQERDMWVFFRPFRWELWLTIVAMCILIGIVLRILEHTAISDAENVRPQKEHNGLIFWFPVAVLAFPERNMVNTNWSRFVLVVWLYMAYVVMQSYTAKLSSIFTLNQLNFKHAEDIYVGYQEGSFVRDIMINRLHFSESRLRTYASVADIHYGMSIGSKNGGYDAIMDEIPYVKLLMNQYGSEYKMIGPTYKTDGFGFAFPLNSQLVMSFSRAILTVTEGSEMNAIMEKNFGPQNSLADQIDSLNKDNPGLTVYNFGGLFIIFVSAMIFAIFCSWTSATQKAVVMAVMARQYSKKILIFFSLGGKDVRTNSNVHPDPAASHHDSSSGEGEVEMIEGIMRMIVDRRIVSSDSTRVSEQIDVDESNQSEEGNNEEIQQVQPDQEAGS